MLTVEGFGFLVTYYHYVYWAFGGLTSLYIFGLSSELWQIRSYCGCLIGYATAKISPLGMVVTTDEAVDGFAAIDAEGGGHIYLAKEGFEEAAKLDEIPRLTYSWLPVLTGMAAVGLHVARYYTGDLLTVSPMFPYLDHAVAALFLLIIIMRCAHVRKVHRTCFNGLAIIFGLLAIISQSAYLQLPLTPIPKLELYVDIVYVMLGLQCLLPFSTSLYCILQTVVSFKTRVRMRSGKFIRALRVLVSIFITLTSCWIITTLVLVFLAIYFTFLDYLVTSLQYIYWVFEGLAIFFIIGYANEFGRIGMWCGCSRCKCCEKRAKRRITPIDDDIELTAIDDRVKTTPIDDRDKMTPIDDQVTPIDEVV